MLYYLKYYNPVCPRFEGNVPERHCQDLLHINPSLHHLCHLPFLWSLFHFFSSNQVHRLWGQDQVPLNSLKTAKTEELHECFVSCLETETGYRLKETNLEAAVIFCDFVCKVDLFSFAQELPELRPVIHTQVVTDKVSVEAVSPPLLPVQQQVRS